MPSKVYWLGLHANRRELGAPLSKVHSAGLVLLKSLGWEQVARDTQEVPVFAFTTRKGANYPADQPGLPVVRQLPHANTAALDDKRRLQQHLHAAGQFNLLPPSWDTVDDFLDCLNQQSSSAATQPCTQPCTDEGQAHVQNTGECTQGSKPSREAATSTSSVEHNVRSFAAEMAAASSNNDSIKSSANKEPYSSNLPGGRYFVKHRLGVKGQAVYPVLTYQQIQVLLQRQGRSRRDFIIQQEVPPLLLGGRKFVLRIPVLVTCCPFKCYMHEDVIVIQHAVLYSANSSDTAAHISSKGRHHPKPVLLSSLPELHGQVMPQLQQLVASSIAAVEPLLVPDCIHPSAVLYHLFGYDCMVDAAGRVVLLEVNSYPAIASGTMSDVDTSVYTGLVGDMVRLLVLPLTDGAEATPGGFMLLTCK